MALLLSFFMLTALNIAAPVDSPVCGALHRDLILAAPFLVKTPPQGELKIIIDTEAKTLTLYENGRFYRDYPVAVGTAKTPTPVGEWKIIHKGYNWGGGFGTRWLGLNVPWGIYGIHGTNKPHSIGTPASHGCIRMHNRHVEDLFSLVKHGTPVIIKGQPSPIGKRVLKEGSVGPDVVNLQLQLKDKGFYIFGAADGRFGKMTVLALKYFQALNGQEISGKLDRETLELLCY